LRWNGVASRYANELVTAHPPLPLPPPRAGEGPGTRAPSTGLFLSLPSPHNVAFIYVCDSILSDATWVVPSIHYITFITAIIISSFNSASFEFVFLFGTV